MDRRMIVGGLAAALGAPRLAGAAETSRLDEPADIVLGRAAGYAATQTQVNDELWGLGSGKRFDVDLEKGSITFINARDWVITAPIQVIGTYSTTSHTWLWGWDHPSVPPPLARDARLALAFGRRHRLERYTTRMFPCDEAECWDFAAVAAYLAGAQGLYRGPTGAARVFMTFGEVTIRKGA